MKSSNIDPKCCTETDRTPPTLAMIRQEELMNNEDMKRTLSPAELYDQALKFRASEDRTNPTPTRDEAMNELYKSTTAKEPPDYTDDFRRFVDAMKYKMRRNAHKGRWEDIGLIEAQILLNKEVEELKEAIRDGNMVEILLEAADVANFAMIVSAIAIDKGK